MRTLNLLVLGFVGAACLQAATPVHAIENVRGKEYHLTSKHGPWMVMVTSFRNIPADQKSEGLTAEEAAAELVFELRGKGIPAYTFSQDAVKGEFETRNRLGREDHRIYAAQRDMICVLAGNYESIEDRTGQSTLNFIKRFRPEFLKSAKSGAIQRPDAATRGPLTGAFLTINPLLKPEDVVQRTVDKDTKYLNTGIPYPLVKSPHKYTVRVATFTGKSVTPLGNSAYRGRENQFDLNLRTSVGFNIVRAGEDAEQLTAFLRNKGLRNQNGDPVLAEAYTYHDKFQSVVTIGGFDSPHDPRIRLIAQYYGPKLVPDTQRLPSSRDPQQVTDEELAKLPKVLTTHTEQLLPPGVDPSSSPRPLQVWTFDTDPQVMLVPRIK